MTENFVKFGDVWMMGPHKLFCGNSTEKHMMDAFLGNEEPVLCVTDPPCGINYKSQASKSDLYELKMKNDHVVDWARAFLNARARVLYVWHSFHKIEIVKGAIESSGYESKQQIIWAKNTVTPRKHQYLPAHESAILAIKNGAITQDVWVKKLREKSVWKINSVPPNARIHPTEKPTGVYTIPIANHTREDDLVIDLFAGSGVLFEACHATKRIGLGVKLCPNLCERILLRMERLGLEVKLERNVFDKQYDIILNIE